MERFSFDSISPEKLDLDQWPRVDPKSIRHDGKRALFDRREEAIRLLVKGESRKSIHRKTGIRSDDLMRLIRRCLALDPEGRIRGFGALIPWNHQEAYTRSASPVAHDLSIGAAGTFEQLLKAYPDMREIIHDEVLKPKKRDRKGRKRIYESGLVRQALHRKVLDACREKGLEARRQYPFNTEMCGYVSLCAYVRKLVLEKGEDAIPSMYGNRAARKLVAGDGSQRPVTGPFGRVECDAHLIDAIFCILIPTIDDQLVKKIVNRIWLLTIKDVDSRVVLGYHLSFRDEPNADDVLQVIQNALSPWKRRDLVIPGMAYNASAGFPSSCDPRLVGSKWSEFSVDGALAFVAGKVGDKMKQLCDTKPFVVNRRSADDRPYIENFFKVMEQHGFHRLPNTTGGGPTSPLRNNPEAAAIRYTIQCEFLEDLVDVLMANYNGTPHDSLFSRSPLEYLVYKCTKTGLWPEQASASEVDQIFFIRKEVTIRGSEKSGRRPYVHYMGANYTSNVLRKCFNLVGKKLAAQINRKDLRTIRIYLENGQEFCTLHAPPPWNATPHTLEMRRAALKLRKKKHRHFTDLDTSDPIVALLSFLEHEALKKKIIPPLYFDVRRYLTAHSDRIQSEYHFHTLEETVPSNPLAPPKDSVANTRSRPQPQSRRELPPPQPALNG